AAPGRPGRTAARGKPQRPPSSGSRTQPFPQTGYTLSRVALKVVPAGDERCDIHNGRTPASYICKDCVRELGVETGPAPAARGKPIRRLRSKLRNTGRRAPRRLRAPGWREVPPEAR